ncbi:hypothetical protein [Bacillus sp. ISL-78]|uniref:hypothetical protein n=2 Tax=unclassified Bacillus (in: firmicutes) TaxID=185979 RepID=UPI001BE79559|nr:hypothetical protein [Bacillus sp. ISL-78]MBT2618646.1 hypothetical protein [Bacillus sp. ISL-78]
MEFKKMLYVGGNSLIFKWTLLVFRWVSYCLFVLWVLVCVGYTLNDNPESPNTLTDDITIIASTLLLSLILLSFPSIFAYVRKRVPIPIKNNGCSITAVEQVLLDDKRINNYDFYKNFLIPKISFLSEDKDFKVRYSQNIPLNDFKILWVLKSNDKKTLYIKLNIEQININSAENIPFKVINKTKNSKFVWKLKWLQSKKKSFKTPSSLSKLFAQIESRQSLVYFQDQKGSPIFVGNVKVNEHMEYYISSITHSSINGDIANLLNRKKSFIEFHDTGRAPLDYELTQI